MSHYRIFHCVLIALGVDSCISRGKECCARRLRALRPYMAHILLISSKTILAGPGQSGMAGQSVGWGGLSSTFFLQIPADPCVFQRLLVYQDAISRTTPMPCSDYLSISMMSIIMLHIHQSSLSAMKDCNYNGRNTHFGHLSYNVKTISLGIANRLPCRARRTNLSQSVKIQDMEAAY